jgi:hypothetical protein
MNKNAYLRMKIGWGTVKMQVVEAFTAQYFVAFFLNTYGRIIYND